MSTKLPCLFLSGLLVGALGVPAPMAAAWGGPGCAPESELRDLVDDALAAAPFGGGRGSTAAGYSVALQHDECGRLAYAVGRRSVAPNRPAQTTTRQHIGSMTKPITTALALMLAEDGLLGPDGIETRVVELLSRSERRRLGRGSDRGSPSCPADIVGVDRVSGQPRSFRARCPKFGKITVRQLLNGNHGLWDFVNEVDRNANGFVDAPGDYFLGDLLRALGVETLPVPAPLTSGFDVLAATGILRHPQARIGGRRLQDFEASFGNTGYQLVGAILELLSGESYDELVSRLIVRPLGLGQMSLVLERPRRSGKLSHQYLVTTGVEADLGGVDETFGNVYPLDEINGHPAIDTFEMGPFVFSNGGGGAGAISAAPDSYVQFFHALVTGGLLSAAAQKTLDEGFVAIEGVAFSHGFALFRSVLPPLGTVVSKGGQTAGSTCQAMHSLAAEGGNGTTVVVCQNSLALFLPNASAGLPPGSTSVDSLAASLLQAAR